MEEFKKILKQYWGYEGFRGIQGDIIQSVVSGKDTLGLMPTGGGKSITFQVSGLYLDGLCLVITPLLALMKDQLDNLNKKGIKAVAIHSGLSRDEITKAFDYATFGDAKFLYISPERLGTTTFKERVHHLNIALITVDEAHCISQWGYDFRPSYLKIAELREYLPDVPVLAITATATDDVIDDIQSKLLFKHRNVLKMSFMRENLFYVVRYTEEKEVQLLHIIESVKGSTIIYVRNRKRTKEIARLLLENNITAANYHAGLTHEQRNEIQMKWTQGITRVIVATNAFGMGIDKADVRLVVHMDIPESLEAYFQEAGRVGRDGKRSFAVLLWSNNDKIQLKKKVAINFPERDTVKRIYDAMGNFFQLAVGAGYMMSYELNIIKFCEAYSFNINTVISSLKILERSGYIDFFEDLEMSSRIHFIMERDDLYKFQVANEEFDSFIKLLLRSYTGLFTDYVFINESLIAKRASVEESVIYEYLKRLNHLKVIKYIPKKKGPQVVYATSREDVNHIHITKEAYDNRKERFEARVNTMINYFTTTYICRSKMLLDYFGESNSQNCGKCDVCQSKKKVDLAEELFKEIAEKIRSLLLEKNQDLDGLCHLLKGSKDSILKVIRWLEDNELIIANESGLYYWEGD